MLHRAHHRLARPMNLRAPRPRQHGSNSARLETGLRIVEARLTSGRVGALNCRLAASESVSCSPMPRRRVGTAYPLFGRRDCVQPPPGPGGSALKAFLVHTMLHFAGAQFVAPPPFAPTSEPALLGAVCLFFGHVCPLATEPGRGVSQAGFHGGFESRTICPRDRRPSSYVTTEEVPEGADRARGAAGDRVWSSGRACRRGLGLPSETLRKGSVRPRPIRGCVRIARAARSVRRSRR